MTNVKKTLYEILEVSPKASSSEIQAAHKRLFEKLQSEKTDLNRAGIDFKLRLLNVASHTLLVPKTRNVYDARLAALKAPAKVGAPPKVALPPDADAVSLKADAAALKADAMSFKADAMSIKAEAMSLKANSEPLMSLKVNSSPLMMEVSYQTPSKVVSSVFANLSSALKKVLVIIGSLIAAIMVIQVAFALMVNHKVEHSAADAAKEEEKVYLQEYYLTHGVRVGSKIEADLLDAENRRKENERREAARAKEMQDEADRRFAEESRRLGEQISENLRRDEERERREEERKQLQLAEERRHQEELERERVEEDRKRTEEARKRLGIE